MFERLKPTSITLGTKTRRPINPEKVEQLAASIRVVGMINPIRVRRLAFAAAPELVAGQHRLAAAILLGMEEVPVVCVDATDNAAQLMEIDEDLIRHELTPAERAALVTLRAALYQLVEAEKRETEERRAAETRIAKEKAREIVKEIKAGLKGKRAAARSRRGLNAAR